MGKKRKQNESTKLQNVTVTTNERDWKLKSPVNQKKKVVAKKIIRHAKSNTKSQKKLAYRNKTVNNVRVEENSGESFNNDIEDSDKDFNASYVSDGEDMDSNSGPNNVLPSVVADLETLENGDLWDKPKFYSLQNKVIAIMSPSCKFYFNGKLHVKVLMGGVEIYGFTFSRRETVVPVEIYSPRGSSLISIETVQKADATTGTEDLCSLLINEGINYSTAVDLQKKVNKLPAGHAVLVLENLENTLTKFLEFHYEFKLFPKIEDPTNYHNCHPKKAKKLLQTVFLYDEMGKQLKKDSYRDTNIITPILNCNVNDRQRILIAGGKSVGKSTTLRSLVNGLLPSRKEVIVIDFDPGQPEFTLPGCLSINIVNSPLMGPNYTHLKVPFYQLYLGSVNVAQCIPRYIQAAKKLVQFLNESLRLQGRTIVVNTMGFCNEIGWDIMVYTIKLIHPTTVIQINSERSKNNFRFLLSSEVINEQRPSCFTGGDDQTSVWETTSDHELHVVPSLAEAKGKFGDLWEMEPRHQRDLSLLAYLSQILKEDEGNAKFLFSPLPRINEIIPYSVPLSRLTISLIQTIVPAPYILATMNGNIVALCGNDEVEDTSESVAVTDDYPKYLLRAPLSTCYGFGIVRGLDVEKGNIFINTPLSIRELEHVNCLVGSIPLPATLISTNRGSAPYVSECVDLPTNRDPRRGYFRLRQRSGTAQDR